MGRHREWWQLEDFGTGGVALDVDSRQYYITQSFKLVRDPSRYCECRMTPDEARAKAQRLLEAADKVEQWNIEGRGR